MNFFKSSKKATNNNNEVVDPAQLRKALFEHISEADFNKTDIERLRKEDYAVSRYFKEDTKSTVDAIKEVLEWRKSLNLSDIKREDFPPEYFESGVFVRHGKDIDGSVVIYLRVQLYKKGEHPFESVKKYVAYVLDQLDRETRGDGWVMCFDCTNAGLSNIDMDLLKFISQALTTYYAENCRYALVYEMPWIMTPVWKIVRTWCTQEERDCIKFATKKELENFIAKDQLPDFLQEH